METIARLRIQCYKYYFSYNTARSPPSAWVERIKSWTSIADSAWSGVKKRTMKAACRMDCAATADSKLRSKAASPATTAAIMFEDAHNRKPSSPEICRCTTDDAVP